MNTYILFIILIIIYLLIKYNEFNKTINLVKKKEYFENDTKIETCKIYPELLQKIIKERNMNNNDIYIPCSYDTCETEIKLFENKSNNLIFIIDGCDTLASKITLWETLKDKYNDGAKKYMPETFILNNSDDMIKFKLHYNNNLMKRNNHMYVLKNFAQRQEGIKLLRNYNEIINSNKEEWYLVQDYLYDPFLIDNRKINIRYYLLITCINGKIEGYIHNNGFMYYTPEYYDENDISFNKHITTGYIDRKVYETNPLTINDFREHLDKININYRKVFDRNVKNLMNKVMIALSNKICKNKKLDGNIRFQLFGCDIAPTSDLKTYLMEINKGPDLDAKDERDKQVKLSVQNDIFKILEKDDNNEFIKIY